MQTVRDGFTYFKSVKYKPDCGLLLSICFDGAVKSKSSNPSLLWTSRPHKMLAVQLDFFLEVNGPLGVDKGFHCQTPGPPT